MLYLKLTGRIVKVTARIVDDKKGISALNQGLLEGFVDGDAVSKGRVIFTTGGLLTDEIFGYHFELVEIEDHQPGETVLKLIRMESANTFFLYPKTYRFENNEYLIYKIGEFSGAVYCAMEGLDFEDFDVEDLYLGELQLDEEIGCGDLISRVYYVPIEDALKIAKVDDKKTARRHIVDMLKNGKAEELDYYRLEIDTGEEFSHWYCVVRNRDGELYNDWLI